MTVRITYTPTQADTCSCAYYRITAQGGNSLEFSAKGQAAGYDVTLSTSSISFGEVQHNSTTNRLLTVQNNSDLPISFQFISDRFNVFGFTMTEGVVKAHSFVRVKINFTPTVCGNYYERVYCIVRNHKVCYVDLMGTCFDILTKPIPLQQKHVNSFRGKVVHGQHKKQHAKTKLKATQPFDPNEINDSLSEVEETSLKTHEDVREVEVN